MIRFLKSTAFKIFAIAAAALIAGSLLSLVLRGSSSPVTSVTSFVFGPVSRLASSVASKFENLPVSFKSSSTLAKRVSELENENDELMERLVDFEQIKHQNEFYKEFLDLKEENSDFVFAQAAIIGRDAADHFSSFTLNKGSLSGIKVNDPVVYGRYLVGVVSAVTPTQCTVNTILNPKVNVAVYEVRTRDLGFVTSTVSLSAEGRCHMPGLSSETAITAGGIVCTSGVGGIYPRDLIIGNVVDVVNDSTDISASAVIEPGANLEKITDVLIITSFDGQTGGKTKSASDN